MIPELLLFLKKCCMVAWTGCKNLLVDIYNLFILLFVHPKSKRRYKYKPRFEYRW